MNREALVERFFEILVSGNRDAARQLIDQARQQKMTPQDLITDLFWPTYELIQRLFRADQMTTLSHHMASRLLRVLVDQNAALLPRPQTRTRTIFAVCGPSDADELGGQMAVDLLEAAGFQVAFAGGGIATDEILARVQEEQPDVLLLFASAAQDLPHIRQLIDTLHEIGACPRLQIAAGGGVFNRAEGLAEELGVDVWAEDPMEMVDVLTNEPMRRAPANQRTVGRNRRVRRAA